MPVLARKESSIHSPRSAGHQSLSSELQLCGGSAYSCSRKRGYQTCKGFGCLRPAQTNCGPPIARTLLILKIWLKTAESLSSKLGPYKRELDRFSSQREAQDLERLTREQAALRTSIAQEGHNTNGNAIS